MIVVIDIKHILSFRLSIIPWCSKKCNKNKQNHTATWSRLAIPEQDRFTASVPPLPPYLFVTAIKYDGFLETV